jgi:hypothetical protein
MKLPKVSNSQSSASEEDKSGSCTSSSSATSTYSSPAKSPSYEPLNELNTNPDNHDLDKKMRFLSVTVEDTMSDSESLAR